MNLIVQLEKFVTIKQLKNDEWPELNLSLTENYAADISNKEPSNVSC